MKQVAIILILSVILLTRAINTGQTPLDDYINLPDASYSFSLNKTINGTGVTGYIIYMISQTWLTPNDSDTSLWDHWVTICVPDNVQSGNVASLTIDGGSNSDPAPGDDNSTMSLCALALASNTISARITKVPNQPITFAGETESVTEDSLIAYSWKHFLNDTSNPFWIIKLPMTKAVVRGMDTIQGFLGNLSSKIPKIEKFVLFGISKRGWAAWTTAIVDPRVTAIIPINIPILNMSATFNSIFEAYGNWSYSFKDYLDVFHQLNTPQFQKLQAIEDPLSYLDRLNFSKYIVCALGDEYFLPDSARYFYNLLPGSNYLRLLPNVTHTLEPFNLDTYIPIGSYINAIVKNISLPQFSWELVRSVNGTATITVNTTSFKGGVKPTSIKVLKASTTTDKQRDFRLRTCNSSEINMDDTSRNNSSDSGCNAPVYWFSEDIQDKGNGTYFVSVNLPVSGWIGFVVELQYDSPAGSLKFSTEANIAPDGYPFPSCGQNC